MYLGLPVVEGQIRMKLNRHHICFSEKKKKKILLVLLWQKPRGIFNVVL